MAPTPRGVAAVLVALALTACSDRSARPSLPVHRERHRRIARRRRRRALARAMGIRPVRRSRPGVEQRGPPDGLRREVGPGYGLATIDSTQPHWFEWHIEDHGIRGASIGYHSVPAGYPGHELSVAILSPSSVDVLPHVRHLVEAGRLLRVSCAGSAAGGGRVSHSRRAHHAVFSPLPAASLVARQDR